MKIAAACFLTASLFAVVSARAEVLQVPEGGRAIPVVSSGVVCGPVAGGWTLENDRRSVRPPSGTETSFSRAIDVKVAPSQDACAGSKQTVTLWATGRWPDLDPAGVLFAPDEGRVELRGQRLVGVQIQWQSSGKTQQTGQDSCVEPTTSGKSQVCVVPLDRSLRSDATLRWLPAGARFGADVTTFDQDGRKVDPATFVLRPARVVLNQLLPNAATVDVSQGTGVVPLPHPRAVVAADCGQARCEISDEGLVVRSVPAGATNLSVRLRLAPRVFVARGETLETAVTASLPIYQCPLQVVSGLPLRDADDSQIVVRLPEQCTRSGNMRWLAGAEPAEVARRVKATDALYVLLRIGRVVGDKVTITAMRADSEGGIIGSVTTRTAPAPRPRASLELPGYGKVEFIPTNRDAVLTVGGAGERAKLVPLSLDGVYAVSSAKGRYLIRGDENAGGFVSLRFGYRVEGLPQELSGANLAVIHEQVQRAVREASVPAPFGTSAERDEPLAELVCADEKGQPWRVPPGKPVRIPYESRDTCRVLVHQERLRPQDGVQEIVLDIDVVPATGGRRSESERMVLRPGGDVRTFWVREPTAQFDRIVVRLSHVIDESRYVLSPTARKGLPAVQWTATVEGGWARLYATVSIPAGLYRVTRPTGQLTLNFGVLSRITYLNRDGKEGLVGLELGLMGVGLIQRQGAIRDWPPTIAAVAGLGLRVPIGGGGAAIGINAWGVREFRDEYYIDSDNRSDPASRWAFIFGPSISIGNVGTNL
jgi:hypothetical protein